MKEITYAQAVCEALDEEMERDENVVLLGEDVAFIGGNFKTSVGLYEKYGDLRVKDTPISEAGFVGMGVGMALTGLRPVVELMFADFLLVAADQVINQAAKIRYMSGGQATVPLTIRCPIGAGRSSAAQHSQSMQAMVSHFPGIKVVVPSTAQEAKGLLKTAIRDNDPVIVFEHKMEYNKKFEIDDVVDPIPFGKANIVREGTDMTIVATSSMVMKSLAAASRLSAEGIECEVIDLRTIVPFDRDTVIQSVKKTGRLIVADEAHERCGIGAEIAADIAEDIFYDLTAPCGRINNPNVPLPFSPALEFPLIPSEEKVYQKVKSYFKIYTQNAPRRSAVSVTPLAMKIACANQIPLEEVTGSGIHGKITKADVDAAGGAAGARGIQPSAEAGAYAPSLFDGKEILEEIPYTGIRKIIGERLSESKFTAPHLYFTQKVNMEKLLRMRDDMNQMQSQKTSVTDYIAKACILALQKHPGMNSSLVHEKIIKYKSINLGIAVAAETGLIVPVVRQAEEMGILKIAEISSHLIDKARQGKLAPDEYTGGTFTISNLGMFGIENFTAIINPPEAGILAVSSVKDEPVAVSCPDGTKSVGIAPMMNIQLSVDHRIADGLLAAQFVTEIKNLLEKPLSLMI